MKKWKDDTCLNRPKTGKLNGGEGGHQNTYDHSKKVLLWGVKTVWESSKEKAPVGTYPVSPKGMWGSQLKEASFI